jgi:hypothetical protein
MIPAKTTRSQLAWFAVAWFCGTSLVVGCRGYHLGNQYLYRSDIRSVHVSFDSDSYRRFLGQRLTESVVKQIELNTPLTITEPELAHSFLRGQLVRESKNAVAEDRFDQPRVVQIDWRVQVDWVDRAGVPLMETVNVNLTNNVEFIPEGGQSMSTAQQELINRVARQIVNQMENHW